MHTYIVRTSIYTVQHRGECNRQWQTLSWRSTRLSGICYWIGGVKGQRVDSQPAMSCSDIQDPTSCCLLGPHTRADGQMDVSEPHHPRYWPPAETTRWCPALHPSPCLDRKAATQWPGMFTVCPASKTRRPWDRHTIKIRYPWVSLLSIYLSPLPSVITFSRKTMSMATKSSPNRWKLKSKSARKTTREPLQLLMRSVSSYLTRYGGL